MNKKYKNIYQGISVKQQKIIDQFPNIEFFQSLFRNICYQDERVDVYIHIDGRISSHDDSINSIEDFKKYLKFKNFQ